ncbi:MAG: DUF4403 family protein [Myxococcota bacterium]
MLLASLLLACQCGSQDREGTPPRVVPTLIDAPADPSTVVVPLSLPLADLERILHGELPMTLLDKADEPLKKDGEDSKWLFDVTIERLGRPQVTSLPDGRVRLALPLGANARVHKADRKGIPITAGMTITADVDLGMTSNWALDPELELGYDWLDEPKVKIAGIKFNLRKKIDKRLEEKIPEIEDAVESALRDSDKLRTKLEEVWAKLGEPQRTKGDPPGWFAVRPEAVYLSRLRADRTNLNLTVGLKGIAAMGLGEAPEIEPVPLPPVARPPQEQGLRLPLDVGISWDELSRLASDQMDERRDQPLIVEGVELALALADVRIYPSEDRLAVGLRYQSDGELWSSDGTAWLLAEPIVDPETRKLRLDRFDYTVDTWDISLDVANADPVRDGIRDAIGEYLAFDYGERIDDALAKANERLSELALPDGGGVVRARLDDVEIGGVAMLEDALVIRTIVSGEARVDLTAPTKPR